MAGPTQSQATATTAATSTTSAIQVVDNLEDKVAELKRELKGYTAPDTVGRDAQRLEALFGEIHSYELQLRQIMGVPWSGNTDNTS